MYSVTDLQGISSHLIAHIAVHYVALNGEHSFGIRRRHINNVAVLFTILHLNSNGNATSALMEPVGRAVSY